MCFHHNHGPHFQIEKDGCSIFSTLQQYLEVKPAILIGLVYVKIQLLWNEEKILMRQQKCMTLAKINKRKDAEWEKNSPEQIESYSEN